MKLSLSLMLALLLVGCNTDRTIKDDNTNVNTTINGDKFEDYKPWWATNDSQTNMAITNGIGNQ